MPTQGVFFLFLPITTNSDQGVRARGVTQKKKSRPALPLNLFALRLLSPFPLFLFFLSRRLLLSFPRSSLTFNMEMDFSQRGDGSTATTTLSIYDDDDDEVIFLSNDDEVNNDGDLMAT